MIELERDLIGLENLVQEGRVRYFVPGSPNCTTVCGRFFLVLLNTAVYIINNFFGIDYKMCFYLAIRERRLFEEDLSKWFSSAHVLLGKKTF